MKQNKRTTKLSLVQDDEIVTSTEQLEFGEESFLEVLPESPYVEGGVNSAESSIYKTIGEELLDGDLDPECWAKAVQCSRGDENRAKQVYLKWRKSKIKHKKLNQDQKLQALELRRLQSFVPMARSSEVCLGSKEFNEATFWEALISIASIGSFLTIARVFELNVYVFLLVSFSMTLIMITGIRAYCVHRVRARLSLGYVKITMLVALLMIVVSLFTTMASAKFEYWF